MSKSNDFNDEVLLMESFPFQFKEATVQREETLQGCAMEVYSDAASWAGDHQRLPNMSEIGQRRNQRGFDYPFGYPYDGPMSRLTEADLREAVRRAQVIYDDAHEVLNFSKGSSE